MNTYLLLFVVSTCASMMLTPLVRRVSERFGWLNQPRDRRHLHPSPVPRLGGVAIFAAILLALSTLFLVNSIVAQTVRASSWEVMRVLIPATLIFLVGVYDDFRGANARVKFAAQGLAGLIFCAMGGRIEALSVPLVGSIELPMVVGYALTLLWTVGICNAFNLIDGMDGLGAGASLFAGLVMLAVSLMLGHPLVTIVAVALCGSLIGFLPYNFNPASIFLGDSGSLFIGFTLAALSVQGTQKASTAVAVAIPLIAFGVPVADTGFSIVRRIIGRRPIFQGDREHVHHMLLARGWSQRRVTLVLYGACALFGLLALLMVSQPGIRSTGLVLFVVGAVIVLAIARLRYHEIDEVKASMRRSFTDRHLRLANNVRLRRASYTMSKATTLKEIFSATEDLLELGEFVYANMKLGRNGNGNGHHNSHEQSGENEALPPHEGNSSKGSIHWSWQRDGVKAEQIMGSGRYWTLRLPLSIQNVEWGYLNLYREFGNEALLLDMACLCDVFQPETAKAVERVFGVNEQQMTPAQLSTDSTPTSQRSESVWENVGSDAAQAVPLRVAI